MKLEQKEIFFPPEWHPVRLEPIPVEKFVFVAYRLLSHKFYEIDYGFIPAEEMKFRSMTRREDCKVITHWMEAPELPTTDIENEYKMLCQK